MYTSTDSVWRPLTAIERLTSQLHDDHGAIGNVAFFAEFAGCIAPDDFQRLIPELMAGCPEGRAAIVVDGRGHRQFIFPAQPATFAEIVAVSDREEVAQRLPVWVQEPFPPGEGPLIRWRLLLPESGEWCQVAVTAHHAAVDATAVVCLLRKLTEALDQPQALKAAWSDAPLPQAQWGTLGRYLKMASRYVRTQRPLRKQSCPLPRQHTGPGLCVVHRWKPDETQRLMSACKAAGTTFTAVLGVTGALALAERLPEVGATATLTVPIDVRRYLAPEAGTRRLGSMITTREYGVPVTSPRDVACEARLISQELREFLEAQGPLRLLALAQLVLPKKIKTLPMPTALSANSLGRFSMPPTSSGLRITGCGWFAGGAEVIAAFSQAAVTIDDCLMLTYFSSRLRPEDVQAIADGSRTRLLAFGQ